MVIGESKYNNHLTELWFKRQTYEATYDKIVNDHFILLLSETPFQTLALRIIVLASSSAGQFWSGKLLLRFWPR